MLAEEHARKARLIKRARSEGATIEMIAKRFALSNTYISNVIFNEMKLCPTCKLQFFASGKKQVRCSQKCWQKQIEVASKEGIPDARA